MNKNDNVSPLGVSIIICCHNSASRLPKTLAHLKAQINPDQIPWEVIIVDNSSTDDTSQVARDEWETITDVPMRIFQEPKLGLSNARMRGIDEAQYEFLCLVDDDNWVGKNWVSTIYEKMLNYPQAGAIGGKSEAVFEAKPPDWFEQFQSSFAVGEQFHEEAYLPPNNLLWGAGLTIRKTAWQSVLDKGFTNLLVDRKGKRLSSGGDSEMCYALLLNHWKLLYSPILFFYHYMPSNRLTWQNLCRLAHGFGQSKAYLSLYIKAVRIAIDNKNYKNRSWLRNIINNIISLLRQPKFLFKAITRRGEGSAEVLRKHYLWGIFSERVKIRQNINKAENQIMSTFKTTT